jgi:hypothetical protein
MSDDTSLLGSASQVIAAGLPDVARDAMNFERQLQGGVSGPNLGWQQNQLLMQQLQDQLSTFQTAMPQGFHSLGDDEPKIRSTSPTFVFNPNPQAPLPFPVQKFIHGIVASGVKEKVYECECADAGDRTLEIMATPVGDPIRDSISGVLTRSVMLAMRTKDKGGSWAVQTFTYFKQNENADWAGASTPDDSVVEG